MRLCSYLVLIFAIFCLSCSNDSNYPDGEITESFEQDYSRNFGFSFDNDTIIDEAMEALNTIQITGDGKMMLYLTFPNIDHQECQGEVSSYEISKEELHDALIDVMAKNNLTLTKKRDLGSRRRLQVHVNYTLCKHVSQQLNPWHQPKVKSLCAKERG